MSSWAEKRKTIGQAIVGITAVAGSASVATLVHGQGALWLAFGVTALSAVAGVVTTYQVPNGATLYDRVAELEKVGVPAVKDIVEAANVDLHAGFAAKAPWAQGAPQATEPVVTA